MLLSWRLPILCFLSEDIIPFHVNTFPLEFFELLPIPISAIFLISHGCRLHAFSQLSHNQQSAWEYTPRLRSCAESELALDHRQLNPKRRVTRATELQEIVRTLLGTKYEANRILEKVKERGNIFPVDLGTGAVLSEVFLLLSYAWFLSPGSPLSSEMRM